MTPLKFPSNENFETWEHADLDYVYIRSDNYEDFMRDIPNDRLEDLEPFATGLLLSHPLSVLGTLYDALSISLPY